MKKYQHRTRSEWQLLVTRQIEFVQSVPAFCNTYDISYASLISWKKRLSDSGAIESSPAYFVEITPAAADVPVPGESVATDPCSEQPCIELDIGAIMQLRIYTR